jgi:hypothetical protein
MRCSFDTKSTDLRSEGKRQNMARHALARAAAKGKSGNCSRLRFGQPSCSVKQEVADSFYSGIIATGRGYCQFAAQANRLCTQAKIKKAKGKNQKVEARTAVVAFNHALLTFAFCPLPFAFCLAAQPLANAVAPADHREESNSE